MNPVIQTYYLSKKYNDLLAVQNMSMTVEKGEIYGFIGLNGAGKTTAIRMLLGMIRPTEGVSYIKGEKVHRKNHHLWKHVGYIVETPHSYPELTVQENLNLYRRLRAVPNQHAVSEVMTLLQLTRYSQVKAKHLSLGNAQRLGIAKALIHSPDILILDEPVNGLDPSGIVEVRELLQNLAFNRGVTILISSHLLSEVSKIATKIGIIHDGQIIQEMQSSDLHKQLLRKLIVNTRNNKRASSTLTEIGYESMLNDDGFIEIVDERAIQFPEDISRHLTFKSIPPTKLVIDEENLETYFLRMIQEKGGHG